MGKDVGADVNTPDGLNYTPIMVASELGDVKMVTTLAKPGAKVTQQDGEGEIILTGAAEHALLIRTTDENEKSALIYAAASGHTETVRMLENSGADIHKKENETTQDEIELVSPVAGQASVLKAEYTETKRVERVVQEKNGVKEAAATTLKDVGADVNTPDVLNYTPIMVASELGDVKMVT